MRRFLKGLTKAAYVIGSVANVAATIAIPNPITAKIAATQILGAIVSSKVSDKKLGKLSKPVNILGFNFDKAENDIDKNWHNYKY